jgi:uncharacterized membrane protein YraQ (UPF0718 family)
VLGWNWTVLRLVLGALLVFGLGYFLNRGMTDTERATAQALAEEQLNQVDTGNAFVRWMKILGQMAIRLIPEYLVLVLILGAVRAFLFPHIGPEINNQLIWIVVFAIAGTLFVIPTAGEVPIIQAMLSLGMGAGPAGALLMTLPPVSVPSIAMLVRSFKPKLLIIVTVTVIAFGILAGLLAVGLGF